MKSYLTMITIDYFQGSDTVSAFREKENVIYQNFAAFSSGSVSNVNIWGSRYEANQPNVEYNWIFMLNDNVPANGPILLKFPPNYFNLESNPLPIGTITSNNIQKSDTTKDFFKYQTNVASLFNHNGYTAGTLLTIRFTGVKNPITEGLTIEFGVESQMPEQYTIDSKSDIPGVRIIAARSAGQITYNYFYTTPNNGFLLGNYYVNFILQNSLPAFGYIEITFPANFNASSFTKTGSYIECYISGPISLIESCTVSSLTIELVIRETLTIAAGTSSVTVLLPSIYNYNTELDSGPVTIRTIYDNVVLDDSGDSETNRKATTGTDAAIMIAGTNYMNFVIAPTTESVSAFYNITVKPINSFNNSAVIQFVFPKIFARGLGSDVSCSSLELQISTLNPLVCSVRDYVLNISNVQTYNTSINTTGFTISLAGITNPSIPSVVLTSKIAFYIYKSPNFVSDYTYSLGSLSYTPAPPILYMSNFVYGSNNTRLISDNGFSLTPIKTASFSYISIEYPNIYRLQEYWDNKTYSLSLEAASSSQAQVYQSLLLTAFGGSITAGQTFTMNLWSLFNPVIPGKAEYPIFYVYDNSIKQIVMKTYNNLNQFETPDFFDNGLIVSVANDVDSLSIEAG